MAANDFALRTIANDCPTLLEQFFPIHPNDVRPLVRESFELAFEQFASCVEGIAVLAKDAMFFLNLYEGQLDVVHGIVLRETDAFLSIQDGVLNHTWTLLGGNTLKVRLIQDNLLVAGLFSNFHSSAAFFVNNTIFTVVGINEELSNLRNQIADVERPYGASTLPPLRAQLHQIQMIMARVLVKMERSKEEVSHARKKVLTRGGVEA